MRLRTEIHVSQNLVAGSSAFMPRVRSARETASLLFWVLTWGQEELCTVRAVGREGMVCEDQMRLVMGQDKRWHVLSGGQNQVRAFLTERPACRPQDQSCLPILAVGWTVLAITPT